MDTASQPTHYLYPGTLFVHRQPHLVTTVLGSCVAVCLWDPVARIGGINHYLLPLWNGEGLPTPKYGNIAITKLVEKIVDCGGNQFRLIGKLFGGAAMWHSAQGLYQVGERNIALAQTQLAEMKIPIAGADLGGNAGRKVIFNTGTGEVMMRRQKPGLSRAGAAP
ncbi:MAG: chemotaxis protein CheD [Desulfuromonadales bacterium]